VGLFHLVLQQDLCEGLTLEGCLGRSRGSTASNPGRRCRSECRPPGSHGLLLVPGSRGCDHLAGLRQALLALPAERARPMSSTLITPCRLLTSRLAGFTSR